MPRLVLELSTEFGYDKVEINKTNWVPQNGVSSEIAGKFGIAQPAPAEKGWWACSANEGCLIPNLPVVSEITPLCGTIYFLV